MRTKTDPLGNTVPESESLDENCIRDYRQGYKEGALKVKKSSVNIGGAMGTLIVVTIFLNANSAYWFL